MAVVYEHTNERIRIEQTRRGMRITFAIIAVLAVASALLTFVIGRTRFETTIACNHATGLCALTIGKSTRSFPISTIRTVRLASSTNDGHASWIWLTESRSHEICGARDPGGEAVAASVATRLEAFLADANQPPVELHCTTQRVNGPSLKVLPLSVLGWLLVMLAFAPFSHEMTTTIDRQAGTIESKGRGWLIRSWNVKRPLADVERIDVRWRYAGYGNRRYLVYAVFKDGTEALLWSPAAVMMKTIDERVAQLRSATTG